LEHNLDPIGPLYHEDADGGSIMSYGTKEEVLSIHETELISGEDKESSSDDLDLDLDS